MSGMIARVKGQAKRIYEIWKYGFDYHYQIPEEGITDTMGSHIYSFHHIGGGESARQHTKGGWSIDWTIEEENEPDPLYGVQTMDVRRYTKWQYMTLREVTFPFIFFFFFFLCKGRDCLKIVCCCYCCGFFVL